MNKADKVLAKIRKSPHEWMVQKLPLCVLPHTNGAADDFLSPGWRMVTHLIVTPRRPEGQHEQD